MLLVLMFILHSDFTFLIVPVLLLVHCARFMLSRRFPVTLCSTCSKHKTSVHTSFHSPSREPSLTPMQPRWWWSTCQMRPLSASSISTRRCSAQPPPLPQPQPPVCRCSDTTSASTPAATPSFECALYSTYAQVGHSYCTECQ